MERKAADSPATAHGYRNKVRTNFRAGNPVGRPIAEWAYITPRFPQGIRASALRVNADVQRETALFWFLSNLRPYDLSTGGPYFGFSGAFNTTPLNSAPLNSNVANFNRGVFAPRRVAAHEALDGEFATILPAVLLSSMAEQLGPDWMWEAAPSIESELPQTPQEIQAAILVVLDELAELVRKLSPGHGQIGHNMPPGDLPITGRERASLLRTIDEAQATITAGGYPDQERLVRASSEIKAIAIRAGIWALGQADTFVSGVTEEGGKAVGKALPVALLIAAVAWWGRAGEFSVFVEKLIAHY